MLDIGFSELLLIAIVGIVVIGPKDLPVVVRHVAKFLRELRGLYAGMKASANKLMAEAGLDDLTRDVTTIIDLEGKPQQAYDVRELNSLRAVESGRKPSPLGGEGLDEGTSSLARDASPPLTQPSPPRGEGSPAAPVADHDKRPLRAEDGA